MQQQRFVLTGDGNNDWRLDERTKMTGRMGVAAARATLQACRRDDATLQELFAA